VWLEKEKTVTKLYYLASSTMAWVEDDMSAICIGYNEKKLN